MTKWKPEDIKIYKVWLKYRKRKEDDYEKESGERERMRKKERERNDPGNRSYQGMNLEGQPFKSSVFGK